MIRQIYGLRQAKQLSFPLRDLIVVPHKKGDLVLAYPAFGPNSYSNNVAEMQKLYVHSEQIPIVQFRPATTAEHLSIVCLDVKAHPELAGFAFEKYARPKIFNPRWLQVGRIVRAQDGVYINPTDAVKSGEVDEAVLKQLRDHSHKVNGIWLGNKDFAFVPYESFRQGVLDAREFAEGGLARGLEHVEGNVAPKLQEMALTYNCGVNVVCFDKSDKPISRVVFLGSGVDSGVYRLRVSGGWDDGEDGHAFGVVDSEARSAEAVSKK
jgi:hypothetical protein